MHATPAANTATHKRTPVLTRLAMQRPEFAVVYPTKLAQSLSMIFRGRMLPCVQVVKYQPLEKQEHQWVEEAMEGIWTRDIKEIK